MATTAVTANTPHTSAHGPLTSTEGSDPHKTSAGTSMVCPDPSAHHTKHSALQNQASAAALYSTNPSKVNTPRTVNPLGSDGKLSSASAAASLKYAKPQDFPSFPVVGIDTKSSAGAAALLANQNKKSPEWWKPEQSSAAGKAALLANGYKMAPLWQPEASAAGSKAALLAHKDGPKLNLWQPEASAEGNSAANIAMRKKNLGPEVDYGYTDQGRKNAFTAATGAHASSTRKRSQSIPASAPIYPDSQNSAKNALSAATIASGPSMAGKSQGISGSDANRTGLGAMEAARIQHAKSISRDMYTSAPPVALEIDEKKHNVALRASAISMAQKMYNVQQQHIDGASGVSAARTGATTAHSQQSSLTDADIKQQAMRYIGIQEAAQKLAQERLAKIGYDENAAYRSYYGYEKPRSRLSIRRGRTRARSASDAAPADDSESDEDDFRSRRIRHQMEQFNRQLADVDAKKRENDRKSLLAAAQRKVQAQMQGMDKKIYDETGKMTPAMMDDWDEKAKQRALANSEARMENHGRVHIGNGKWMSQSEIDAIAQARIQPTLDEITEKTEKRLADDEKRRAEEEERRLDLEEKKRREKAEKERAAEIKAEEKQHRDEEKRAAKARAAEAKAVAKQEKEAEKMKKAEGHRQSKEEKRKSKEASAAVPADGVGKAHAAPTTATTTDNDDLYEEPSTSAAALNSGHNSVDPTSPTSPTAPSSSKGIKSLLNKLKRRSKHAPGLESDEEVKQKDEAFTGGANLRSSESEPQPTLSKSEGEAQRGSSELNSPAKLSDVEPIYVPHVGEVRYTDVSSVSDKEEEDGPVTRGRTTERVVSGGTVTSGGTDFEEAKDHFDADLAPPPTFTSEAEKSRKGSPVRDSKFHEVGL